MADVARCLPLSSLSSPAAHDTQHVVLVPTCQAARPVLGNPSEVWNWKGVGLWGRKGRRIRADEAGLLGASKPRPSHSFPGQSGPQPLATSDLWRGFSVYHGLGVSRPSVLEAQSPAGGASDM